ncbi:MAG: Xaa-Pro peptidase family protein [bacterium]
MDFAKRVSNIQKTFLESKKNGLLVFGVENVYYLTSFRGSFSVLIVLKSKAYLFVDGRYYEKAKNCSSLCEVILFENLAGEIEKIVKAEKVAELFFDAEDVTVAFISELTEKLKDIKLTPSAKKIVKDLRSIKDEAEIKVMKEGAKKSKKIIKKFLDENLKAGVTERLLASQLEFIIKNQAEGISFDTIVASGKNSSLPHAVPTKRKIGKNDIVLIDYGLRWKGYCTDHTRTTILGVNRLEKYYNIVEEAIRVGLSCVKPGNAISLLDEKIRAFFQRKGVLNNFLHSSGHGIGLSVHEKPTLSYKTKGVFKEGMVFTIEPGLYFEGIGGIRLEEMFYVTKKGYEIL